MASAEIVVLQVAVHNVVELTKRAVNQIEGKVRPELVVRSTARRNDRLLSKDEQELVAQTRHPRIKQLKSDELLDIIQHLRHSHNRARGRNNSRSSDTSAFGTSMTPIPEIKESAGHRAKRTLLSAALQRANKETHRRISKGARSKPM